MPKQQKTYTREFKLEAVQLVKSSGKPMSQIARELDITRQERDIVKKVVSIYSRDAR